MTTTVRTTAGIAFDRAGPPGALPVVLVHAGVADRRMWDALWGRLVAQRDTIRLDLRGFGESVDRPVGPLSPHRDLLATLAELAVTRAHLVGVSMGAGVAVDAALASPGTASSLFLTAPGGSLIPAMTPELRAFVHAEEVALSAGDLDAAVAANLLTWVDGPGQPPDRVRAEVRRSVAEMQRLAFELTDDWDDVDEDELAPAALDRLGDIDVPTLVLTGGLDLEAIAAAAAAVLAGVPAARRVEWADVAHLPPMERPTEFVQVLTAWLREVESGS